MLLVGRPSEGTFPWDAPVRLSLWSLVGPFRFVNCERAFVFARFFSFCFIIRRSFCFKLLTDEELRRKKKVMMMIEDSWRFGIDG